MLNQDIMKEFLFDCRMRKLSERTIKGYKNNNLAMLHFIKEEYEISELEDTNHITIKAYIDFLTKKGLSEVYINGLIKCFKAYFAYFMREQYIYKNPMDKVYRQKEPISLINTFNDEEVKKMIRYYTGSKFLEIQWKLLKELSLTVVMVVMLGKK